MRQAHEIAHKAIASQKEDFKKVAQRYEMTMKDGTQVEVAKSVAKAQSDGMRQLSDSALHLRQELYATDVLQMRPQTGLQDHDRQLARQRETVQNEAEELIKEHSRIMHIVAENIKLIFKICALRNKMHSLMKRKVPSQKRKQKLPSSKSPRKGITKMF